MAIAGCPPIAICPASDGSVASCNTNCECVYCGNASQIATCKQTCTQTQGAPGIGVNPAPIAGALNATQVALQNALLAPIEAYLPLILEKIGLFLFALVLVVAGFLTLKQ